MVKRCDLRYVAVYDLEKSNVTGIGEEVESLRLNIGVVQDGPLEVLLGQFSVSRVARILANGLDSIWAVFRFLSTGNRS